MDFNFKKKYGQNFITDSNLLSAIVREAGVTNETNVLEIGAGAGTLTYELCKTAKKVISYEIDQELIETIQSRMQGFDNFTLINQDIMNADIKHIEDMFNGEEYVIVANLPYYITTPIIFKFIEGAHNLRAMSIMVQKEVAERICAHPGTKDYGITSVIIDSIGKAKITRIVNRKMFYPEPNVDSAMLYIEFINKYNIDQLSFNKFVGKCFNMRRKTLVNNLIMYGMSREQAETALDKLGVDRNIRSEALTTDQFVRLFDIVG